MTKQPHQLTTLDISRLVKIAPSFDIEVLSSIEDEMVHLSIREPRTQESLELHLPRDVAVCRLLAEVCSRTVRWVYFHAGEPASRSLLKHTDARLARISDLYQRWKAAGCPA